MDIQLLIKQIAKHYPKDAHYKYSINESNTDNNIKTNLLNELANSRFSLPNDVLYSFIDNKTSHHVRIQSHNLVLNCIAPYDVMPPIRFLLRICKRISCIMNIFSIDKSYTIWLLPIQLNRTFPDGSMVQPININGGYTYMNGTTIYVYRYEECAKVLLHEILHHSIFDTYGKWTSNQVDEIRNVCNIDSTFDLNINEAIIEFWAILLECLFVSYEYNIPYLVLLKKEQDWSTQQSYKLLEYQKKYFKEWKEQTNSYCYIIIKTVLLLNYEEFIKIKTPYSTEILKDFILINFKKLFESYFKKVAAKKVKIENSSMRMTLFGDI